MIKKPGDGMFVPLTPARNIELLENSCARLPKLLQLKVPSCMLLNEIRILHDRAITAIANVVNSEHKRARERKQKDTPATDEQA